MVKKMTACMVAFAIIFLMWPAQGLFFAENRAFLHAFYPSSVAYSPQMGQYIQQLDAVSFAWCRLDIVQLPEGDKPVLNTTKGENGNSGFYFPEDYLEPLRIAKASGIPAMLNIFSSSDNAMRILPYPEKRAQLITAIIEKLTTDMGSGEGITFDGVVIDFEALMDLSPKGNELIVEGIRPSMYLNTFLAELKAALDANNKKLYTAVNTRNYFNGYDYKEIARLSEKVILMAHDYEPGGALNKTDINRFLTYDTPLQQDSPAPIIRIKQALQDMVDSVGAPAVMNKVILQVAFDAAQWKFSLEAPTLKEWETLGNDTPSDGEKMTPTYMMIKDRLDNLDGAAVGLTVGYNQELQSPWLTYFNTTTNSFNVILYENSRSMAAKIKAAEWYGLGGVSLWSLGNMADFNDEAGKKQGMDIWENILKLTRKNTSWGTENLLTLQKEKGIRFVDKKVEAAIRAKLGRKTGKIFARDLAEIYRVKLPAGAAKLNDLSALPNLEYLDAGNGSISDLSSLARLTKLKALYLQKNNITSIKSLSNLKGLEVLSLNNNKIKDFKPLAGLKNLRELGLESNNIIDISFAKGLKNLTYFNISGNQVKNLAPLGGMSKLKMLYLQRNKAIDITILGNLRNLETLSLNGNGIVNITVLGKLTSLRQLYIRDNKIADLKPLYGLQTLNSLYIKGNPLKDISEIQTQFSQMTDRDF